MAACNAYGPAVVLERVGAGQSGLAPADVEPVPCAPVLVQAAARAARRTDARPQPRRLELHQRDQPVHLRLVGHERSEHASEAQRLGAELGSHPVLPVGGRIALVEDEVDHLEHGAEPAARSSPAGTSKGTPALAIVFLARTMRWAMVGSGTT